MASTDVTNTLQANITSTEQSSSNVPINRGTGSPSFAAGVGQFTTYFLLPGGQSSIPLPFSPVTQLYIKNLDVAHSILVVWTQNSGAAQPVIELNPGDQIMFWCNPSGPFIPGITALWMTPNAGTALVEFFLGG